MSTALRWVAGSSTPEKVYLTRVWNYGTWEEWRDMWKRFSAATILDTVRHPLRGLWTRRGRALAQTVCGCRMPDDAVISYEP